MHKQNHHPPALEDRVKLWLHVTNRKKMPIHAAFPDGAVHISYIAHGKDNTLIFAASKLHQMFPKDAIVRIKTCGKDKDKRETKEIRVGDVGALERNGVDADMVLKRVSNQELAIIEADICEFLWRKFSEARAMSACSLHPRACRLDVRVPSIAGPLDASSSSSMSMESGVRMVPMRRFALSASSAMRRWPKDAASRGRLAIAVAQSMLEPLRILHALDFVHLDIKPANILMPTHGSEVASDMKRATLTDYETILRSEDLMERIDLNRDVAIYVGTVRYMSPVLTLKVSSLFRATCVAAGLTPSSPAVHASRNSFDTPTVCDMHSLAMTLCELAGAHQRPASPSVSRAIRQILTAKSALQIKK